MDLKNFMFGPAITSEEAICERCKDPMDPRTNVIPTGELVCDNCMSMDDIFPDDEEE